MPKQLILVGIRERFDGKAQRFSGRIIKMAGTISTIVRLAVNRTAPSTLTCSGARPRVSSSGSKVSLRIAVSGQASGAIKGDRHPKSGTNLHSQQQSG